MKIRSDWVPKEMPQGLVDSLANFRQTRSFDAQEWVSRKTHLLHDYLATSGLKAVVVAVSGGIDSAVVLGLCKKLHELDSDIKIVPLLLPSFEDEGVTNQETATALGQVVCETFGFTTHVLNMNPLVSVIDEGVQEATGLASSTWARGQLVSYSRTPVLYYTTSLLTDAGYPAVILGTTNYSEGSYLGYVGKASDGMVDIQLISDLYKSEVYAVAEVLGVPRAVLDTAPTGDMFDKMTDEEVFGATYDFVELFLETLNHPDVELNLTPEDQTFFDHHASALKDMHRYNKHKYLVASPSIHLDLRSYNLNLWKINNWSGIS